MHFIRRDRRLDRIFSGPLLHPVVIIPRVVEIPNHRCSAWRFFLQEANRVGLVDPVSVMRRLDVVLVHRSFADSRNEALPDSRTPTRPQAMCLRMPLVEAPKYRDFACIRRPNTERRSPILARASQVCAHLVVDPVMAAFVEEIEVVLGQQREIMTHGTGGGFRWLAHRFTRHASSHACTLPSVPNWPVFCSMPTC